jgi:hypothetical protein
MNSYFEPQLDFAPNQRYGAPRDFDSRISNG